MTTRRQFLKRAALGSAALSCSVPAWARTIAPSFSDLKITRIAYYAAPGYTKPTFNQARGIVTIETDGGITGVGEGGSEHMLTQNAEWLIGEDPFRIEHHWQTMYRGYFYPAGREKLHALGALDMALWDLKGKALGVPVYELLGGLTRDFVPCYSTGFPNQGSLEATAQACMDAGFKAFRTGGRTPGRGSFEPHDWVDSIVRDCEEIRRGVGEAGAWAIDLHTRFDPAQAVRLCRLLEPLDPIFVEDLVRSENPGVYARLRPQVQVPIAVGEQFGDRWDLNELVEQHLIDYSRVTLPNSGGITEMMKIAAICETHFVGMIPHFTGPISTAALVHVLAATPGFAMAEIVRDRPETIPYLNEDYVIFKEGRLYPNDAPGLGVDFSPEKATLITQVTERSRPNLDHPLFHRPDGSYTNW